MFDRILVANRGEIACRVMRTARAMGIETVAVYSAADAQALHAETADAKVHVGPAASAESYLVPERIIQACKDTEAQAVHPGYGFLSENTKFAKALDEAGIVFIGPPAKAIAAMGDKIESKKLAQEAGVNTVPGHMGLIEDADEAVKIAQDIGYPVMIKASAGGGGKGMRIAHNDDEARDGFRSARNEAKSSFADDRIFIEKFIEEPRHIEIQVLGDKHGNCIHLGERECSIQRRHQKVIEEAPSPFLDEKTREAMGAQAVALAQAVGYHSAGTVEFIVDKDKNFYFLEMNTRLQVEHPVTELVTGLDLVELMIRVAAGEALPIGQKDVKMQGWAVECRVYAEDPLRNFLPSIGRLRHYIEPEGEGIRIDSGVVEGSEISMFYDPMISKLCAYGPDRDTAIERMRAALDAYYIRGINHNMSFLAAVMAHPRFQEGRLSTNFIPEEYPDGFTGLHLSDSARRAVESVAAVLQYRCDLRESSIHGQVEGHSKQVRNDWMVMIDETRRAIRVEETDGGHRVYNGEDVECLVEGAWSPGEPIFACRIDGMPASIQVDRDGAAWRLTYGGATLRVLVVRPRVAELSREMPKKEPPDLSKYLLSPMPGLLVSVTVDEGTEVKAGEELAVVEAMKMENILRAERDGKVVKMHAQPGDSLAVDQAILEFE
ncbi:MAG: acetyl/propionyl/methylcrotonyl-CoA carboxylase subunit alpha [Rhodovibrionaceae bacterium]|nr:acetyl/propionyl/methylcrotonyl-CoA carboxylase subunit alpha [Rhodovibrionaceae bacterium]